jgi:ATP-dependent Zn protease
VSARIAIERARTAYHEAGHLVIGMLFGFRCSSVSIRPDDARGSLGRVVPLEGHGGQVAVEISRGTIDRWVSVLFAGYAAEVRFAPGARDAAREGARGDDDQAETYLERAGMANDSTRHLLRARTADLVEQHWAAIESVARALLKHEEFDAREAERICERAVPRELAEPGNRRREVGA